jgi:hypothetical protein
MDASKVTVYIQKTAARFHLNRHIEKVFDLTQRDLPSDVGYSYLIEPFWICDTFLVLIWIHLY